MCYGETDLSAAAGRHGSPAAVFGKELAALAVLEQDGIVSVDGTRVEVRPGGRLLLRSVAAVFDEYLGPEMEQRSEEHTSELQSLMSISYAVFCLTKQNKLQQHSYTT